MTKFASFIIKLLKVAVEAATNSSMILLFVIAFVIKDAIPNTDKDPVVALLSLIAAGVIIIAFHIGKPMIEIAYDSNSDK